jgi:hypothetical protein
LFRRPKLTLSCSAEGKKEDLLLLSGKRLLDRPRHRWENNIKMDLREIGWGGTDRIDLAEDRDQWRALVNMVMNQRVP